MHHRRPLGLQAPGLADLDYDYDSRGRLVAVRQSDGAETREYRFAYDSFGYLDSVTDPLQRQVQIINDRDGRPTRLDLPDGRQIALATDANGNLTTLTTPKGDVHRFGYDPLDRENRYEAPAVEATPTVTTTTYDRDGQPQQQDLPGGVRLNFGYDAFGRLDSVSRPSQNGDAGNEVKLDYAYDGPLLTRESSTGTVAGEVRYQYDSDFRLSGLTAPGAETNYRFDADGLLTRASVVDTEPGLGSGEVELILSRDADHGLLSGTSSGVVSDEWTWSAFAEPSRYEATAGATGLYRADFQRDALGRITRKTETVLGVATTYDYRYDLAGRLDQVSINGSVDESYSYDGNGNRLSLTRGPSSKRALLPSPRGGGGGGEGSAKPAPPRLSAAPKTTTSYTYDAQDRLLSQGDCTYTYTANGELSEQTCGGQTTRYSYSLHGDLTAAELPDGRQLEYVVDGRGRRVGKQVNGELVQGLVYMNQLEPVAELDGDGNVVASFIYADRAHVPSLMLKGGKTYRIVSDHLGSVRLVVDIATGAVAQRMDYDAWGNVLLDTNPGFQPFGYAGGIYDRDTGLVRFGARDYGADAGRWNSKDGALYKGGGFNWYVYTGSDPINFLDSTGNARERIDGNVITVHQNDVDPWPSSPHGHIYDRNQVVDRNGRIYNSATRDSVGQLSKKGKVKWNSFLKRLGYLGTALAIGDVFFGEQDAIAAVSETLMIGEIACADFDCNPRDGVDDRMALRKAPALISPIGYQQCEK